jgi:hypothetical protein
MPTSSFAAPKEWDGAPSWALRQHKFRQIVISDVMWLEEMQYLQANPRYDLRSTEPKVGSSNLSGRVANHLVISTFWA